MKPKIRLVQTADGVNYLVPFVLITTLFFLWGFAHSILDVLNKHFQDALSISKTHSALIQAVVYGGYFLMAMPAGEIIRPPIGMVSILIYNNCMFLDLNPDPKITDIHSLTPSRIANKIDRSVSCNA